MRSGRCEKGGCGSLFGLVSFGGGMENGQGMVIADGGL